MCGKVSHKKMTLIWNRIKGDERWKLIQLKANNAANAVNWILILLLGILPMFVDAQMTFTLQRVTTLGLIYFGVRNLIEFIGYAP